MAESSQGSSWMQLPCCALKSPGLHKDPSLLGCFQLCLYGVGASPASATPLFPTPLCRGPGVASPSEGPHCPPLAFTGDSSISLHLEPHGVCFSKDLATAQGVSSQLQPALPLVPLHHYFLSFPAPHLIPPRSHSAPFP